MKTSDDNGWLATEGPPSVETHMAGSLSLLESQGVASISELASKTPTARFEESRRMHKLRPETQFPKYWTEYSNESTDTAQTDQTPRRTGVLWHGSEPF